MFRYGLKALVGILIVAQLVGGVMLGFCRHYHIYSFDGWRVYQAMKHECHPIWQEYNSGRIRAGDDVERVIALTHPAIVERKGRWTELRYQGDGYFTGVSAAAYNGKMVFAAAWSCCWVRRFF